MQTRLPIGSPVSAWQEDAVDRPSTRNQLKGRHTSHNVTRKSFHDVRQFSRDSHLPSRRQLHVMSREGHSIFHKCRRKNWLTFQKHVAEQFAGHVAQNCALYVYKNIESCILNWRRTWEHKEKKGSLCPPVTRYLALSSDYSMISGKFIKRKTKAINKKKSKNKKQKNKNLWTGNWQDARSPSL